MASHTAYSLYVTARLVAKSGTPWDGEVAVCGWRLGADFGTSSPWDYDTGTRSLQSFLVNDASTTSSTTHLDKIQNWAGDSGVAGVNVTDGDQDGIAEAVYTLYANQSSNLTSTYKLGDIRLYPIGNAGKMVSNGPCLYTPTSELTGSGSPLPPNLAVAVTTRSHAVGRKGRGRFYFGPISSNMLGSTGLVSASPRTSLLADVVAFFEAVRGIGGGTAASYTPVIVHADHVSAAVISSVSIGDEFDVMNSRRHQRPESYASTTLT